MTSSWPPPPGPPSQPGPPNPRDAVPGRGTPVRKTSRIWDGTGSRSKRTNRLAIASLVLSILWLGWIGSVLGVVFGFLAHRQIRRTQNAQRGNTLASAGIVLGVLGLALLAVGIAHRRSVGKTPGGVASQSTQPNSTSRAAVAPQLAPTGVRVVSSGFTQRAGQGQDFISYGVVLENPDRASAVAVHVNETFFDVHGRSLATDTQVLTGVPAHSRFDVGGDVSSNISLRVSRMKVTAKAQGAVEAITLPEVTSVAIRGSNFSAKVVGGFRNPYHVVLPGSATIYLVYVNPHGQVVGGDAEPTGASVRPGASVAFSDALMSITPKAGTSVHASIDPNGYPKPGSGTISWYG